MVRVSTDNAETETGRFCDDAKELTANTANHRNHGPATAPHVMKAASPTATTSPSAGVYAVTLLARNNQPTRLAGRLEHVMSGRRHDFDNGAALLACLALEQRLAGLAADATTLSTPTS